MAEHDTSNDRNERVFAFDDGIAVIGLAGRFPGARDVASFWHNLCAGVESISVLEDSELEDAFDAKTRASSTYVRARGLLDDVDRFDAAFFGIHAREAELMDPQHRVLLETAWEALEDAGCDPTRSDRRIGVYAGSSINTYMLKHVMRDRGTIEAFASDYQVGSFPTLVGGGSDFLATRIAYKLDLRGPAMTVQSACSTSLLAIAQAVQALRMRQADVMLAGAVSITFPQHRGYLYQDGGMVSRDGHCRTFDVAADGTVFGAGAGIVVLKRLADARADGDRIYAVVRGVGLTNDGAAKVGYTAPSVAGQAAAIVDAHRAAGFDAGSIDYVECHGTATPLGDPIEVAALAQAFANRTESRCAIGSVKPNVGHLDVAAGMAGFIKTALAVYHGTLPPTLHFTALNPRIDFAGTPFYVNTKLAPWPETQATRRAGVSAFGVGGTNVHLVLESEPAVVRNRVAQRPELLIFSARTDAALARNAARLAEYLRANPAIELADVAWTLQSGRRAFARRRSVVATSPSEAIAACEIIARDDTARRVATAGARVAFLFPGQGSQYVGMGRELYAGEPIFRDAVDRCAEIARPLLDADLRTYLYPRDGAGPDATLALTMTAIAQPAIFTVSYGLAELWRSWGIVPVATAGHSVGEFVSATLAGVFQVEDALRVVIERGRLMQALQPGAMLAVRLGEAELAALLPTGVVLAALNSPTQSVAAGSYDAIAALEAILAARGVLARRVATSHAFHSPMMAPMRAPLEELISRLTLSAPMQPYVSTATGTWIDAAQATSPVYWADHALRTVRFGDALATLVESGIEAFLEVGPGAALATNARQGVAREASYAIASSLVVGDRIGGEIGGLLDALGTLWTAGVTPDWNALRGLRETHHISLPAYAFEATRHWIDAASSQIDVAHPIDKVISETSESEDVNVSCADDLAALLEELSGERIGAGDRTTTFLELGFDSLFLGRFVQQIAARFGAAVTFRQLLGEMPTLSTLAAYVDSVAPKIVRTVEMKPTPAPMMLVENTEHATHQSPIEAIMRAQLAAMQQLVRAQLEALRQTGAGSAESPSAVPIAPSVAHATVKPALAVDTNASRFEVFRTSPAPSTDLTDAQRTHVAELVARVTAKTAKSKEYTQRYRSVLADPRVAAGFRSEWKEMVYPIVCERAAGPRLWDIDGNEYVDILNGFGQTAFGHAPDFVTAAVRAQLDAGFAIGPQADVAGEVAERFCAMTGNERMTFCNTGSEAVMAAMRVARTVTGRERIVVFGGAYHGQFDEVLVKGARDSERSIPIAPGIPAASVQNITVLKYATPESLEWVREHAATLAAVIVEPVQSRHPSLQPKAFLQELRAITAAAGTALVFDEVVTGFRVHPGGMQAVFDIRADLATYGKVVGGGMPIGILAGKARFMDALDGGMWSYGDDSTPEVAPTFFAGTFVRHPLVMQAVLAVLRHLEAHGPTLQAALTARTTGLVDRLNADLEARGLHSRIETFASLFFFNFTTEERFAGLLYYHMRERGIYVQEGFPCFLTTAHGEAEIDAIVDAFVDSLDELQRAGIFTPAGVVASAHAAPRAIVEVALTDEQTEIWIAAQSSDEASCAFNESVTIRLSGALDRPAFEEAWKRVIARHDALRATFAPTGETMRIAPQLETVCATLDLRDRSLALAECELERFLVRDAETPFDLVSGPLVRGTIVQLAEVEHAFVFSAHHLVCDGWSINTILGELASLYTAIATDVAPDLCIPLRFAAYAASKARRPASEREAIEAYWLARFEEPPEMLDLPIDRPRPARKTYTGATHSVAIDAPAYAALKKAGAKNGCTLFVTLLTAFELLLGRLGKRDDVVACVPAAGQALLDGRTLVGHCVNFLPIRSRWDERSRLGDVLVSTRTAVLEAYEHQQYTLGALVRVKKFERARNRLPLVEAQFNLERLSDDLAFAGLQSKVSPNAKAFVNFDLFLNVIESDAGLRLDCDYNSDLFDRPTIKRWMRIYRAVLDEIVNDSATPVVAMSLDEDVPEFVVGDPTHAPSIVAGATLPYPRCAIHTLFEARAALQPDARAVSCGDESLSYGELDSRANRLARHLRSIVGDDAKRIGIAMMRSCDMIVVILACLKAGFAYVPLDPTQPATRRRAILAEAGVGALVVDSAAALDAMPSGVPAIHIHEDRAAIERCGEEILGNYVPPESAAYTIFTSGTTGVPKGVEVAHRSVVNLVTSMAVEPGFGSSDVLVAVTTIAFDMAVFEIYLPLSTGGTVVVATSDEVVDGNRLCALLERTKATMLQSTPATWRLLLEAGFRSATGFRMLSGGEALPRVLADRLLEGDGELWNVYGPTETTVYATRARIHRGETIAIGLPLDNTQAYILDDRGRPLERGATGELYVGGDALALGYLNASELTARQFIPNPFDGDRMYRTGDAARMRLDGTIETFGRLDDQIKLRGFRIEPGEIETALARAADLAAVAVALHESDGRSQLVAYLVPRRSISIDCEALAVRLRAELPEYMIPSAWVTLDALPLSTNGKLDRRALPAPAETVTSPKELRTPLERQLGAIWAEVLGRERIGHDDDIFKLGADSIQIFQIVARANRQGIVLNARDLMQKRTIGNVVLGITSHEPVAGRRLTKAPVSRGEIARELPLEASA